MTAYLVCHPCNTRQLIGEMTVFHHCLHCGKARYSEDASGNPMVSWSNRQDPTDWSTDMAQTRPLW